MTLRKGALENNVGKGENAGKPNFFPFPTVFSTLSKKEIIIGATFNSLPNDKILDWFKLKAFADDKINVIEILKVDLGRVENIVRKGENAGYQHFLLFPQCFPKLSLLELLKVRIVW